MDLIGMLDIIIIIFFLSITRALNKLEQSYIQNISSN